jgi:hypothetical protein
MSRIRHPTWTEDDIRRLKLLADAQVSADYIARSLERSVASVIRKAIWLNLRLRRRVDAKAAQ